MAKFTEQDTEKMYDEVDALCRKFWDKEGSLHWGYYDNFSSTGFLAASDRWNEIMLQKSRIDENSVVLDVGCGNGNTDIFIAERVGCRIVGVDISGLRIENARKLAQRSGFSDTLEFEKASITDLPFKSNLFTQVWSQATLYHVHNLKKALREIYRVLQPSGIFVFDDLIQERKHVSNTAQQHVFDRMMFESTFSKDEYVAQLEKLHFTVLLSVDLSLHLRRNYELLAQKVKPVSEERHYSYLKMCEAIDRNEIGWAFFLCQK